MEQMLLGGNDSSSGESDNEDSSKKAAPPPAAAPRTTHVLPQAPSRTPAPSAPGITDQKQLLKSLYSPANNRPPPQQQPLTQQQQQQPPMRQQQQQPQQHPQMMPPPQMQQHHPMQQPKQQQPLPQQRAPHPGPVQQKPQNLGMQQQQQRSRIPAKPMMMPQQQRTSSGMQQQQHRSMQQQPPPSNMMRPTMAPPSRATSDPFEPTPVVHRAPQAPVFQQQHQQPRAIPPQQQQRPVVQRPPVQQQQQQRVISAQDRQLMEKKQKEKFIVFTRVLMKYLEQKDAGLHTKVKDIIKDCAERNKKKERGYESVTQSMKKRLKEVVPEHYWKRAEAYMVHLVNKQKAHANDPNNRRTPGTLATSMSAATTTSSSSSSRPMQVQQQQQQQQQQRGIVSSSGGIKAQVPLAQQRPSQGQSTMDAKKAQQQHRQPMPKAAPSFQPVQQHQPKKPNPSPSSNASSSKARSSSKATRRTSDATDTSQTAVAPPREYNELLPMVDHAMNYDWKTAGSLLGGTKTQAMLTEEQNKLLNDYRVVQPVQETPESFFPRDDWGRRNVVSTRVAFARLRCSKLGATTPWTNEDVAEDDPTLAILSEGAQLYLKGVLKKALHSARQRQNFDGTRIWYQQQQRNATTPPEFAVRLGCDVNRQLAVSQANAAMTSKRLEEAVTRKQTKPTHEITPETIANATSMSDLALTPTLATATTTLDDVGKRNLQIYGGKDSREPPLGRLPKRPRLEVADFVAGMSFSRRRGGQRASSMSSAFFY